MTESVIIRTLVALATIHGVVYQMDEKIAFRNDDVEEEIYMSQSKGCVVSR